MALTLSDVVEFLEKNGKDSSTELTARKVMERGVLLEGASSEPGVNFEVERHQAVLGDHFKPGMGMNAFVTRWEKYYFDGEDITCEGEARPPNFDPTHINYAGVADSITEDMSFDFEVREDGRFDASELTYGHNSIVASLDEAEEFGRKIAGEWDLSSCLADIEDLVSANKLQEVLQQLNDSAMESAGDKARDSLAGEMSKLGSK